MFSNCFICFLLFSVVKAGNDTAVNSSNGVNSVYGVTDFIKNNDSNPTVNSFNGTNGVNSINGSNDDISKNVNDYANIIVNAFNGVSGVNGSTDGNVDKIVDELNVRDSCFPFFSSNIIFWTSILLHLFDYF